ncbi:hypothetical protein [Arsenicibacter rosenii]|uniref:hypothetical protein n=1 Tax=Arsenicibacter rosenii TaxID=1750698 RepID=UPI0015A60D99|nr:hypothetical protein [Arsenicibacter rosenii]
MVEEEIEDEDLIGQEWPGGFEGRVWEWVNYDWISEYGELLSGFVASKEEESMYKSYD